MVKAAVASARTLPTESDSEHFSSSDDSDADQMDELEKGKGAAGGGGGGGAANTKTAKKHAAAAAGGDEANNNYKANNTGKPGTPGGLKRRFFKWWFEEDAFVDDHGEGDGVDGRGADVFSEEFGEAEKRRQRGVVLSWFREFGLDAMPNVFVWLPAYDFKKCLFTDVLAGIVISVILLPQVSVVWASCLHASSA